MICRPEITLCNKKPDLFVILLCTVDMATNQKRRLSTEENHIQLTKELETGNTNNPLDRYSAQKHPGTTHQPMVLHKGDLAQEFCFKCTEMVYRCLNRPQTRGSYPWRHNRTIDTFALAASGKHCGLCAMLASILGEHHEILTHIREIHRDVEHGISDWAMKVVEERTSIVLLAGYEVPAYSQLPLKFQVTAFWPARSRFLAREYHITLAATLILFQPTNTLNASYKILEFKHPDRPSGTGSGMADAHLAPDRRLEGAQKLSDIQAWSEISLKWSGELDQYSKGDSSVLPARLLDLSMEGVVKLVDCSTLTGDNHPEFFRHVQWPWLKPVYPIYTALSHQWGTSQHLILTSETERQWREGMPMEQLPKTFRDAAFVTRYLGISLIWIDALTIIQNSEQDWGQESVKMGDIFMNAIITIAAHCAQDDSEGFLLVALQKREAIIHHVEDRPVGICRPPDPVADVTQSSLAKRGWVLQERLLASRTLHFTRGQIYMEDCSGVTCEGNSTSRSTEVSLVGPKSDFSRSFVYRPIFSPSSLPELRNFFHRQGSSYQDDIHRPEGKHVRLEWLSLIEMYSRCRLTKDTDRLMAITGMARKFSNFTRVTWCAGIWADFICQGLLWLPTKVGLVRPSTTKAPSWSWASWEGPIQYPEAFHNRRPGFHARCSFVSAKSQDGEPTTWLNTSGSIVLRGRLLWLKNVQFQTRQSLGPGLHEKHDRAKSSAMKSILLSHHVDVYGLLASGMQIGWAAFDSLLLTSSGRITTGSRSKFEDFFPGISDAEFAFLILGDFTSDTSFLGICLRRPLHSQGAFTRLAFAEINEQYLVAYPRSAKSNVERNLSASEDQRPSWGESFFDEAEMSIVTIE